MSGSGYHDVHLPADPAREVVWQVIAEYVTRWVPADARILEIGAGYCCWISAMAAIWSYLRPNPPPNSRPPRLCLHTSP